MNIPAARDSKGRFVKGSRHLLTHGMYRTQFHNTWNNINIRCNKPNSKSWKYYGDQGIKNEWASFEDFKRDMYPSYLIHVALHGEKNTTIDRKDNNENYSKNNCRWATRLVQSRNRRRTRGWKLNRSKTSFAAKVKGML